MGYRISANSPLKRDKGQRFVMPKVWRTKKAAEEHKENVNERNPKANARIIKVDIDRKRKGDKRVRV